MEITPFKNKKEDVPGRPLSECILYYLCADSCDTWELLALEVLEHSTTTCRNVAYLVSITHLSYSCN